MDKSLTLLFFSLTIMFVMFAFLGALINNRKLGLTSVTLACITLLLTLIVPAGRVSAENPTKQEIIVGLSYFIQHDAGSDAGLRGVVTKVHELPLYKSDRPATPILEVEITNHSRGVVFKSGFLPLGPIPNVGDVVEIIQVETGGGYDGMMFATFARKLE